MNFLHISDIHYRSSYPGGPGGYEKMLTQMQCPLKFLRESLKEAMREAAIDVVLLSGDLTEEGSAEDYRTLKACIMETTGDCPVIITPGNHDNKKNLRIGWLDMTEERAEQEGDAPCHFVKELETAVVVSFDSSVEGCSDGNVDEERLCWLRQNLMEAKKAGKPVILMMHHQLVYQLEGVPPIPQREQIMEILRETRPSAVVCGHTHHHYVGRVAEIPYYIADSMSFRGENLEVGGVSFEEGYGYNIYHLDENGIDQCRTKMNLTGRCLGKIIF